MFILMFIWDNACIVWSDVKTYFKDAIFAQCYYVLTSLICIAEYTFPIGSFESRDLRLILTVRPAM